MAIKQIWGKLLDGGKLLFEGERFVSETEGLAANWRITFAATQEIYELFIAGPVMVELSDGRRGNAVADRTGGRPLELVVTLKGSGPLM